MTNWLEEANGVVGEVEKLIEGVKNIQKVVGDVADTYRVRSGRGRRRKLYSSLTSVGMENVGLDFDEMETIINALRHRDEDSLFVELFDSDVRLVSQVDRVKRKLRSARDAVEGALRDLKSCKGDARLEPQYMELAKALHIRLKVFDRLDELETLDPDALRRLGEVYHLLMDKTDDLRAALAKYVDKDD